MRQSMIPLAAILTGGKASRMGGRKERLTLAGRPLVEHVYGRVRQAARRVVCVGGEGGLGGQGVETIPDLFPGADSLGGIATALIHARLMLGEDALVLCVACDMPFVEPDLLLALFGLAGGRDIVVPRTGAGYEPLCALYRARAADLFADRARRGELRIRDVFALLPTLEVEESTLRRHDPALVSFWNVNRPGDLERAETLLRERRSAVTLGESPAASG